MASKKRLDVAVMDLGFAKSRENAKAIIMAGEVFVNEQRALKAGQEVTETDKVEFRGKKLKYVSRGGLKLEKAMEVFPIDLTDCVCMDIGASTGGFTDCMLMNGASKVYSIDVGYGQLAWKLRTDPRVVNLERTNFRYVTKEQVDSDIDFASVDVSFISLTKILPVMKELLKPGASAVTLIKPQFEAGKDKVGKKGVVRDSAVHKEVVSKIVDFALETGFSVLGLDFSPVRGPEGNIEYLLYISNTDNPQLLIETDISDLVDLSHERL